MKTIKTVTQIDINEDSIHLGKIGYYSHVNGEFLNPDQIGKFYCGSTSIPRNWFINLLIKGLFKYASYLKRKEAEASIKEAKRIKKHFAKFKEAKIDNITYCNIEGKCK